MIQNQQKAGTTSAGAKEVIIEKDEKTREDLFPIVSVCLPMSPSPPSLPSSAAAAALSRLVASCPASCWPQSIFVHGPPQSGKATITEDIIFDKDKIDGVACVVSCVPAAIHSRLVLQDIVR